MKHGFKLALLAFVSLSALNMGGCAREVLREEVAMRVATPAWMVKREIDAGPFHLMSFERMHEREQVATIYIEGDGKSNESLNKTLFDATPVNPVALHMATKDKAANVAYLARPCQYTDSFEHEKNDETYCGKEFWAGNQYHPEILSAYNTVLDKIKGRYGITAFHLIGYDSGATIAASLAGERQDVLSLRSVAGKFDMQTLTPRLPALRFIPQQHFIGGADLTVPPAILHNYLQALEPTDCADYAMIQEAEHEKGWVDKWPELLRAKPPACAAPPQPEFIPIEKPEPIYYPRDTGLNK
ncbi:MAG: hypothetical protein IT559_03105 [Alphaproteobacteria bacterium]|nr:hypothetical protein [Alphaproteobacteria bacterium]